MAKTAAQPKTMESNHKVASVLSTGLFAILCVLIAFPLLAGFFASFQEGREVVMKGMSLNLDFSKMHLITTNTCFPEMRIPENILCGIKTV